MHIDKIFEVDNKRIKEIMERIPRDEQLLEVLIRHANKLAKKQEAKMKPRQKRGH